MAFKERLKEARVNSKLTQEQLGDLIGVAKSTITGYEKGNSEPGMVKTQKIIEVLQIDANYLFQDDFKDTKKAPPSEDEDADKNELIENYDSMNGAGQEELLKHSRLLLKDSQYLVCDKSKLGTEPA